jgi:hypothetical protein
MAPASASSPPSASLERAKDFAPDILISEWTNIAEYSSEAEERATARTTAPTRSRSSCAPRWSSPLRGTAWCSSDPSPIYRTINGNIHVVGVHKSSKGLNNRAIRLAKHQHNWLRAYRDLYPFSFTDAWAAQGFGKAP